MEYQILSYTPTLAVRASEMNGLEFLPGATKDKLTPCFLLAPWANSNSLDRTIDRIERAYPNRRYILDVDRDYQLTNLESRPQMQLARLMDSADSFRNWIEFVQEHDQIWPCIQSRGLTQSEIRRQIEAFQDIGRPYCMRISRERFPSNLEQIISAFAERGEADFIIILEGGWTRDPLSLAAWFSGIISDSLGAIDASVPTVISCTSIPKMFTEFRGVTPVLFNNRELVERVGSQSNRARVIYGDWGSTRPREDNGYANRPWYRIDYPVDDAWYVARDRIDAWDFGRAAEAIVSRSTIWDGTLGIWGEEMIQRTTINSELGINTPQKNVAARVNIHLHRQAFAGHRMPMASDFEEDWQD